MTLQHRLTPNYISGISIIAISLMLTNCDNSSTNTVDAEKENVTGSESQTINDIASVLAGPHRSEEQKARDQYRHPLETLEFFGIKGDMSVVEIWPGSGWYTDILAPFLANSGNYYGAAPDPGENERRKAGLQRFKDKLDGNRELYGAAEVKLLNDNGPKSIDPNSADLVLTFRNIHNWMAAGNENQIFARMLEITKNGGFLGVVEHRGDPSIEQDPKAKSGYVNEGFTIQLAEAAGWKLIAASDINNNALDDKDYEGRVWRLPPTLKYFGKEGYPALVGEDLERKKAIGESDRFTLLFQKPE
jgi:predicted methyltransferase